MKFLARVSHIYIYIVRFSNFKQSREFPEDENGQKYFILGFIFGTKERNVGAMQNGGRKGDSAGDIQEAEWREG